MTEPSDAEVEAFIDKHPYGGTYDEIAEVLGVTRQRVPQILNGAIAKVLKALKRRGIRTTDDIAPRTHYSHRTTDSLYS
jgi:predicted transcriptional regulator